MKVTHVRRPCLNDQFNKNWRCDEGATGVSVRCKFWNYWIIIYVFRGFENINIGIWNIYVSGCCLIEADQVWKFSSPNEWVSSVHGNLSDLSD